MDFESFNQQEAIYYSLGFNNRQSKAQIYYDA